MKVLIQRYGIVIKSIDVTGERARIGNSPDSEVMIDDPYLSANVADLVKRGGEWRIVDSGTSLEGVLREGNRVEDEPLASGVTYHVGGFELVIEGLEVPKVTAERPLAPASGARPVMRTVMEDSPLVPRTMMETDSTPIIPRTMFETPLPSQNIPASQSAAPARPVASVPQAVPASAPAPPPQRRRNLKPLIFALAGGVVLLLIIAVLTSGKKKPVAVAKVVPKSAPVAPAPVLAPVTGDDQIARLQIDEALKTWEEKLKSGEDAALRDRFCLVASEVAAVHAASGNPTRAREYYQRIVNVGSAESELVKNARAKL